MTKVGEIVKGVLAGNRRSIAKAITIVENDLDEARELITQIYPHTGKAHVIGLTGAGGAGKSTLIEKIVREYRRRGRRWGLSPLILPVPSREARF